MHIRLTTAIFTVLMLCILGGCGASANQVRQQAEAGDAAAQHQLALRYEQGQGVPRNMNQALRWHEKAAAQDYLPAISDLGFLYMQGDGVRHDYARAMQLHRNAAAKGGAAAMHNLGHMYDQALGVSEDDAEAARWYRQAADRGHAASQLNLGVMYIDGHGVPRDVIEGMKWLHLARMNPANKQAQWNARAALEELGWSPTGVDRTAISEDQEKEVQRRIAQWQREHTTR